MHVIYLAKVTYLSKMDSFFKKKERLRGRQSLIHFFAMTSSTNYGEQGSSTLTSCVAENLCTLPQLILLHQLILLSSVFCTVLGHSH